MPYHLRKNGKKTCVYKGRQGEDGSLVKCHDDPESAKAHLKALYKNVKDAAVLAHAEPSLASEPSYAVPVRLYFREGELTPDGRAIDANSINFNRQPPLPLRVQFTQPESGGHAGAELCGVVTRLARDGTIIIGDGVIDTRIEAGAKAAQLAVAGPGGEPPILQTWSPDLGNVVVYAEHNATDEDDTVPQDHRDHVVEATLLGFTIVALPAVDSAVFEMFDMAGNVITPAPSRLGPDIEPYERSVVTPVMATAIKQSVTACIGTNDPPAEFFTLPDESLLDYDTTITSDGRIFGLVGMEDQCHIGYMDRCITVKDIADGLDPDCNWEYASAGATFTAEGTKIRTGPIAIKGGHADTGWSPGRAMAHYDDPAAAIADVVYFRTSNDDIAFSGALRPGVTDDQKRIVRASGVSLDARPIGGKLRYLATCCVNTRGIPNVKVRLAASAEEGHEPEILALVASAGGCRKCDEAADIITEDDDDDTDLRNSVRRLTSIVANSGLESDAFDKLTDRIFDQLEKRIS